MTEIFSLSALRLTRGHLKGSLTKLATYTESIRDSTSEYELETKLNDDGNTDPVPDFDEVFKFLMVTSILLSAIRERQRAANNQDIVRRLADQQQVLIESLNKSNFSRNSDSYPPSIRIEPFSGNYHEWPAFRDMFTGAVHNKTNLSNIQKFHFLKSCLRNEALSLLSHLPVCDATYERAWGKLEKRYDRPRHVINSYIKTFMELPCSHNSNASQLRKISDGADEIVRGLTSINSVSRDPWLICILSSKVDPETRQAWSEDSVSEDYPNFEMFINFLERRCEALENSKISVRETKPVKAAARSMHASSSSLACPKCNSAHGLSYCPDFLSMTVKSRREFVKNQKICLNCLRIGHSSVRCQSKFRCKTCNTRHHTLVHDGSVNSNLNPSANAFLSNSINQNQNNAPICINRSNNPIIPSTSGDVEFIVNNHSLNFTHHIPQTLLPTAIAKVLYINGKYQLVRILIDSGSQVSFVTESCVQRLGLKRRTSRIPITGIGSTSAGKSRGLVSLVITSRCDLFSITVDTYILSSVTTNLPTDSFSIENWDHISGLNLADPGFNQPNSVDILLGADNVWDILQGNVIHNKLGQPIAQKTIFDWVLAGKLPSCSKSGVLSHHSSLDIDAILQSFWTIEEVDSKPNLSMENKQIEEQFVWTHRRDSNGKYCVDLPFKTTPQFSDTLNGALSRLKSMECKFSKSKSLFQSYSRFLDEYLELGHMSEIPSSEIVKPNVFYLPHHAVLKPDSTTTKLRVVFDGSYKDTNGNSLNDSLLVGPPIQRNLFSVCLRFRRHRFVFTADIVKMFRKIFVSEKDSDFQRIVWRKSPTEPLQHFRLRTVTYGTSCAPFLSVRVLEQLAKDHIKEFPIVSEILLNDFYVDDVVSGADTLADAIFKKQSLIKLLSKCDVQLSKWQGNCPELLGVYWNSQSDIFSFRLNYIADQPFTKRQILKDVARIFDPLGLLAPSVVQLKMVFQELWHLKLDWDDKIPASIAAKWSRFREELSILTKIEIPRIIGLSHTSLCLYM